MKWTKQWPERGWYWAFVLPSEDLQAVYVHDGLFVDMNSCVHRETIATNVIFWSSPLEFPPLPWELMPPQCRVGREGGE